MKKQNLLTFTFYLLTAVCYVSCTFDYGEREHFDDDLPDLVMENVEYVRVRSADPLARFQAERAERFDNLGVMRLQNFSFEQYGERGEEINAQGSAVFASVDIDSGDIFMDLGVRLEVESEDIIIKTNQLEWLDEPRILSTGRDDNVNILRENGTSFTGVNLRVDARQRTWEFAGNVSGIFIHEDEEENEEIIELEDDAI
jgi:LPS export ABC transporter protein LptC